MPRFQPQVEAERPALEVRDRLVRRLVRLQRPFVGGGRRLAVEHPLRDEERPGDDGQHQRAGEQRAGPDAAAPAATTDAARAISRPIAAPTEITSTRADTLLMSRQPEQQRQTEHRRDPAGSRAPAIADGATTNTAADSSMTSVSLVIMPSRWAPSGSTAASASATTRARRDSGSHFSSADPDQDQAQHPPQRRQPAQRPRVEAPPDQHRRDHVIERRVRGGRVEVQRRQRVLAWRCTGCGASAR